VSVQLTIITDHTSGATTLARPLLSRQVLSAVIKGQHCTPQVRKRVRLGKLEWMEETVRGLLISAREWSGGTGDATGNAGYCKTRATDYYVPGPLVQARKLKRDTLLLLSMSAIFPSTAAGGSGTMGHPRFNCQCHVT